MKKLKWKSIIVLALILVSVVFNIMWIWGAIILFWTVSGLITEHTFLAETIEKKENPVLYWIAICLWAFLGLYILAEAFAPDILPASWQTTN